MTAALKQEQLQPLPKDLLQWDDADPLGPMELTGAYYTRGLEQGRAEGRAEGFVQAIEGACELLGIPFGPNERALLQTLDAEGLAALHTQLCETRRWPTL